MKDQIEEAINSLIDSEKNPVVGDYIDELDGIMQEAFLGWGGPGPKKNDMITFGEELELSVQGLLQGFEEKI